MKATPDDLGGRRLACASYAYSWLRLLDSNAPYAEQPHRELTERRRKEHVSTRRFGTAWRTISRRSWRRPVWFGILFAVNMQVSFLSPPFGPAAFYLKGVAPPEIALKGIFTALVPVIGMQMIVLMLLLFFPRLAMWPLN